MRKIEGRNPVYEALCSNTIIDKIYVSKNLAEGAVSKVLKIANQRDIQIQYVDNKELLKLSNNNNNRHQGIIAVAEEYKYKEIDDIFDLANKRDESPFIVILDELTDVHNLGAIVRTAECLGAHGIIIPKHRAASINSIVAKTSAGAIEYLPIVKVTNINNIIDELKDKGLWIYGADMNGKNYIYQESFKGPVGIVIGSEGNGISKLTKKKCDVLVKVPMKGNINSLNASCAASIFIYEVLRQRGM